MFPVYRDARRGPRSTARSGTGGRCRRFRYVSYGGDGTRTRSCPTRASTSTTPRRNKRPRFLPDIDNLVAVDQIRRMIQPQPPPNCIAEREDAVAPWSRPDRRLAAPRHRGPGPGTGLADAERGVLRPARPARGARAGPGAAQPVGARAQGPQARRLPAHPGGQGRHRRYPGLLHRPAAGAARPAARGPGDPHRHRRDRRRAVCRGGLRPRSQRSSA